METIQFHFSSNTLSTHGDSSIPLVLQYTLHTWRQLKFSLSSNTISTHGDSSIPSPHMETVEVLLVLQYHLHTWRLDDDNNNGEFIQHFQRLKVLYNLKNSNETCNTQIPIHKSGAQTKHTKIDKHFHTKHGKIHVQS